MKKILILGAGVYQYPLIKSSKELGYYTIVASINGNYPGFKIADKVYYENTTNMDMILKIAEEEKISGICTSGTDVAVKSIGYVCDKLGLNGITFETASKLSNKGLMKQCFIENDIRTAKYKVFDFKETATNIMNFSNEIDYPVVIKIHDSSGSRGIEIVKEPSRLISSISNIKQYTKEKTFLIEQYIAGEEFGAQVFVVEGEIKCVMHHGDIIDIRKTGIPVGHYYPYNIEKNTYDDMLEQIRRTIKAFKIKTGALNFDFIIFKDKVYVLEVGARAGGTMLPELLSNIYGINYYDNIIYACIREFNKIKFQYKNNKSCLVNLIYSEKDGILDNVVMPTTNFDYEYHIDYCSGDKINKFENGSDRIGDYLILSDDTNINKLLEKQKYINENILIYIK